MICPDCKAENIEGAEFCESCGADLQDLSRPSAEDEFTEHLLSDQLGEIDAQEPAVVAPGDPVALAIHQMQRTGLGCVLVNEGGQLAGILTERDVLLKAAGDKVDLNALAVRDLMTPDPVVLREDDTLAVALHNMSVGGFRHIPLVKDGRTRKLVSIRDVVRHISSFIPQALTSAT
ncbi:MAG: CBS domain-containing protein [Dehalococcoidia bacterium]